MSVDVLLDVQHFINVSMWCWEQVLFIRLILQPMTSACYPIHFVPIQCSLAGTLLLARHLTCIDCLALCTCVCLCIQIYRETKHLKLVDREPIQECAHLPVHSCYSEFGLTCNAEDRHLAI